MACPLYVGVHVHVAHAVPYRDPFLGGWGVDELCTHRIKANLMWKTALPVFWQYFYIKFSSFSLDVDFTKRNVYCVIYKCTTRTDMWNVTRIKTELANHTFFMMVRNPFDRLVSAYYDKAFLPAQRICRFHFARSSLLAKWSEVKFSLTSLILSRFWVEIFTWLTIT